MQAADSAIGEAPNHPLAVRMGIIAGVSHNLIIGTIMGSFSVLLASVQQRLNIRAEEASAGIPLVLLGASVIAPFAGVLMAKVSLKLVLLVGALLGASGFLLLATTHSYTVYLIAYGLCLGPALSLSGSIGPATLVTRWFTRNRGLAIGIVHLPIVIAILPVALNWFLERNGAVVSYLAIAACILLILVPMTLLVRDHPPTGETLAPEPSADRTGDGSFTMGQLLSKPRFWAMCLAAIASMTSSVLLGSLLVPIGVAWGFTRGQSALLASIMSLVGLAGSVLFGWVSDRIGGARTLAVIGLDCAVLWSLLLMQPSFPVVVVVIGLIGMHGAGAIPGLGRAISDTYGQASFSRGFGLNTVIALPFMAVAVIGAARTFTQTGSYNTAITCMAAFFVVALVLGLYASSGRKVQPLEVSPA